MKVAHVSDYDTHAVVGGKNIQEFQIAQTSEFFGILSSALYANKPLAVAREVLCNGWDSHLVSGVANVAIQVTITEDKMIIRDYGAGIPHDLIHQIYCTYGESTKQNDGKQTGGFGLGSKAPFAYSDHFTVINHHAGLKVIHAISRGSARNGGVPERREIVSVPTTEQGVEVQVPLKSKEDGELFKKLIGDIARWGEMKVEINSRMVDTIPISKAENNLFLTTERPSGNINKINVRYGNVVYPVLPDVEYIGAYEALMAALKGIPSTNSWNDNENSFSLILQAAPHSISVTPSRESLALTDTTIETLKSLMGDITKHIASGTADFERLLMSEQEVAINHYFRMGLPHRILLSKNLLTEEDYPGNKDYRYSSKHQITNLVALGRYYLTYKKKLSDEINEKMRLRRVEAVYQGGFRRKTDLLKYLNICKKIPDQLFWKEFRKQVFRPIAKRLSLLPGGDARHFYVVTPDANKSRMGWWPAAAYKASSDLAPRLLTGVVIVTHNRTSVEQDFFSLMPKNTIRYANIDKQFLAYVAPRNKGTKEAVIAELQRLGFLVIDFASVADAAKAEADARYLAKTGTTAKVHRVLPPKPKGLVLLSHNLHKDKNYQMFFPKKHFEENAPRTENYDYVYKPGSGNTSYFWPWGSYGEEAVATLFGSQIGLCVSQPQYESQLKKGKKPALPMILEKLKTEVLTNPTVREYVELNLGQAKLRHHAYYLLQLAEHSTRLRSIFGLPPVIDTGKLPYYELYEALKRKSEYGSYRHEDWAIVVNDITKVVETWTIPQHFLDLSDRAQKSEGLELLDLNEMMHALAEIAQETQPDIKKKTFIEMSIINALNF